MTTRSLISRSRDLRQRATETDGLPGSPEKFERLSSERRKLREMNEDLEAALESATKEFIGLESRLFEVVGLAVRGPNGHAWMTDFPARENASAFYQKLREIVRWAAERSEASK